MGRGGFGGVGGVQRGQNKTGSQMVGHQKTLAHKISMIKEQVN